MRDHVVRATDFSGRYHATLYLRFPQTFLSYDLGLFSEASLSPLFFSYSSCFFFVVSLSLVSKKPGTSSPASYCPNVLLRTWSLFSRFQNSVRTAVPPMSLALPSFLDSLLPLHTTWSISIPPDVTPLLNPRHSPTVVFLRSDLNCCPFFSGDPAFFLAVPNPGLPAPR